MAERTLTVDRRSKLTHRQFMDEYARPQKPVIVEGAFEGWQARTRWTFDFFRRAYGSRAVEIDGRTRQLADVIDLVLRSSAEDPAPYLRNLSIEQWAPELTADISPLPDYTVPNWLDSRFFPERPSLTSVELYIGGSGATFPVLHYDGMHTHAFLMQLQGVKEYVMYAPECGEFLYPRPGDPNKSSIPDIERPDLDRFPLFARAAGGRCRLGPGEMLFVPAGWWHTARILEPSITVSANTVNASNWQVFARDYIAARARHRPWWRVQAVGAYLTVFGLCETLLSM